MSISGEISMPCSSPLLPSGSHDMPSFLVDADECFEFPQFRFR